MLKVVHNSSIGNTPAAISREDKTLYINPELFYSFTPFQQKFIILHELGHYTLNTRSELDADTYAFNNIAGTQYRSLKSCIAAIEETLEDGNQTKEQRYNNIVYQALKWDYEHGNKAVYEDLIRAMEICSYNGKNTMRNKSKHDVYAETRRFIEQYNGDAAPSAIAGLEGVLDRGAHTIKALEDSANAREQLEAQAQAQRDSEKQRELQRKKETMVAGALSLIILLQIITLIVLTKRTN